MSETKHTPGPWTCKIDGDYSITTAGGMIRVYSVAHELDDNAIRVAYVDGEWTVDADEWIANANLIAAAPDLYRALEPFARNQPHYSQCESMKCGDCDGCRARAALAKARGEA